jgi:hypothetical protein
MRRHRTAKGRFTKRAKNPKRRSHKRRRNGGGLGRTAFLARMAAGKRKAAKAKTSSPKRKSHKKHARKATSSRRRIRPTVLVSRSGKYFRPRRSKYFTRPRRINRRRRNGFGSGIMSSIKRIFTLNSVTNYLGIGGGIFVGTMLSKMLNTGMVPFTTTMLPASITDTLSNKYVRPFHGFIHIIAGTLLAAKVKNKYAKDIGIGLAALGGFDLLTQLLSATGMVGLPTFSGMNVNLLGRTSYSGHQLSGMNVDLSGMNVDMLGNDARSDDAESGYLADNINDMLS